MKKLNEELLAFAAEKRIDLVGVTHPGIIRCLPWSYDDDPEHYSPLGRTRVSPVTYDPKIIMPDACAVIMTGLYLYGFDKLTASVPGSPRGNIGPWTRGYVEAGRYASDTIVDFLRGKGYKAEFTNELPYRTLAVRCGLGRIGNNGFLYHDGMGCYIRLGCVLTSAPLGTVDCGSVSRPNDCGSCRICSTVCPTGALKGPHEYDADECLHLWLQGQGTCKDGIPPEKRHSCENYLMRTGKCLAMCRRNRKLKPRTEFPFSAEDKDDSPELIPLVMASDEEYRRRLPYHVYKYGIDHIRKNVLIALGNLRDPASVPALGRGLQELTPDCRALCAWALGQIGSEEAITQLRAALSAESDPDVQREIRQALINK